MNEILDQLAPSVSSSINLNVLMPFLLKHGLVTNDESHHLTCPTTAPSEKALQLLHYLKYKGDGTLQKFLCSLNSETQHSGHKGIVIKLTQLLNKHHQNQFCSLCNTHVHTY